MIGRTAIPTMAGVATIAVIVGLIVGSVAFPMTRTTTIFQSSEVTSTQTVFSLASRISTTTTTTITITTTTIAIELEQQQQQTVSNREGIELSESLNTTTIAVGQSLNITLTIFNTFPSVNSVPTSTDWQFQGVPVAVWPPCFYNVPMRVIVLQGNYMAQQLPSVANATFPINCMEGWSIDHVIFQPKSDQANITGRYSVTNTNQTLGPFNLQLNFTTSGYWDLQNLSKELNPPILGQLYPPESPSSIAFVPGVYTVAVEDEWGQEVIMHFFVIPSQ